MRSFFIVGEGGVGEVITRVDAAEEEEDDDEEVCCRSSPLPSIFEVALILMAEEVVGKLFTLQSPCCNILDMLR